MTGSRVTVVFGGGGAKAAAHAGVARALAEAGVKPVRWIGTSMGAAMAAAMASGRTADQLLERFATLDAGELVSRRRFALLKGIWAPALLRMEPLTRLFRELVPVDSFDAMPTRCNITAVDADSGERVVFGAGGATIPVHEAIAASCALPPYYAPVMVAGRRFYDGGLRGPLPLDLAAGDGSDAVIAVDVGPGFDERSGSLQSPPALLAATDAAIGWLMAGTTELMLNAWRKSENGQRLVYLRPTSDRGATFAVDRVEQYAEAGYRMMQSRLDELGT